MKIFHFLLVFLITFAVVGGVSAQQPEIIEAVPQELSAGQFEGDVYSNSRLGFSLSIPTGWIVMKQDNFAQTVAAGTELIKSNNSKANGKIEAGMKREVLLFYVTKFPMGSPGNSVLTASATKQLDPRVTARMLLDASIKTVSANPNIKLVRPIEERKIGGRSFQYAEIMMYINGIIMRNRIYLSVSRGYTLGFSHMYTRDEDEQVFDGVLASLKFTK